jgi:DNA polymerase III alpha subunit
VLCSEAYLTGFYYKPRIDRELLEKHSEGLIAINGHLGSEIGEHLLAYSSEGGGDEALGGRGREREVARAASSTRRATAALLCRAAAPHPGAELDQPAPDQARARV